MTSIFEGQPPPKTRPFPIKRRVIWVPGKHNYQSHSECTWGHGDLRPPKSKRQMSTSQWHTPSLEGGTRVVPFDVDPVFLLLMVNVEAKHGTHNPPKMRCHSMPFQLKQKHLPKRSTQCMIYIYILYIYHPKLPSFVGK